MEIQIQSVKPYLLRNDQIGDWVYSETRPGYVITVSNNIKTNESQLAVALHELIECFLCKRNGIDDGTVCQFDKMYEDERKAGHWKDEEPGDDPRSPYRAEHQAADHVERAVCNALGITWEQHEANCSSQRQPEPEKEADRH